MRHRKQTQHIRRYKSGRWICINRGVRYKIGWKKGKFKFGDFIYLQPNSRVTLSVTGKNLNLNKVNEHELWAIDAYNSNTGMFNISRVLNPYPGAYCSWVHKKDIIALK